MFSYTLESRYALAPPDSWREMDSFATESAAMETMRYGCSDLLDDTLLKVVHDRRVQKFGLVVHGEGRVVCERPAYYGVKEGNDVYEWFAQCMFNWEFAWIQCPKPQWLGYLIGGCKTDRRLVGRAVCDLLGQFILSSRHERMVDATQAWIDGNINTHKVLLTCEECLVESPRRTDLDYGIYFLCSYCFADNLSSAMSGGIHWFNESKIIKRGGEFLARHLRENISLADLLRNNTKLIAL